MAFSNYYVKLGTTELIDPSPRSYQLQRIVIDADSERNASGNLIRNIVNTKYKINLVFPPMFASKMKTLLGLLATNTISVTYWDEKSGTYRTGNFYANDLITNPLFKKGGNEILYDEYSVNLIEY